MTAGGLCLLAAVMCLSIPRACAAMDTAREQDGHRRRHQR